MPKVRPRDRGFTLLSISFLAGNSSFVDRAYTPLHEELFLRRPIVKPGLAARGISGNGSGGGSGTAGDRRDAMVRDFQ